MCQCPLEHHDSKLLAEVLEKLLQKPFLAEVREKLNREPCLAEVLEKLRLVATRRDQEETATTSAFDRVVADEPTQRHYNTARAGHTSAAPPARQQNPSNTDFNIEFADARTSFRDSTGTTADITKCSLCKVLWIFWLVIVAGSLAVGLWRSIVTSDEGKGFTDAAYIVAIGGVILYPVQDRHSRRCRQRLPR